MMKAITFDCWDTLIADDESRSVKRKEYFTLLFNENGFPTTSDEMDVLFSKEAKLFENHIIEHWKTQNSRVRAKTIVKLSGVKLPASEIAKLADYGDRIALEYPPPVIPGIEEALEVLSKIYTLGVICNTGWHSSSTVRQLLENSDLVKYFSHLTFSDEAGVAKPHKQIFEYTVKKLGFRTQEAVHIGDSEYSDIVGAKKAKMRAILFSGINKKYKYDNSADITISTYDTLVDLIERMQETG